MVDQAEVHRMAHNEDVSERIEAVKQLEDYFSILDDKEQARNDLLELTKDEDKYVRWYAADVLGSVFVHVTDREQAWEGILALTKDEDKYVRRNAVDVLASTFAHVTDKEQATKDLLELTKDGNSDVRRSAAHALDSSFIHITNKEQVWKNLLALTKDEDSDVRTTAAHALGSSFAHVTDKEQTTKDLLELTKDGNSDVRWSAALALGSSFAHVTNKEQATKDLLELTKDENINVRWGAAIGLGSSFAHVTNKEQATKDLLELTKDESSFVRWGAARALGSSFAHITNKEQATKNLLELIKENDRDVREYANHSLGRVYIFKATESKSEEDYRENLENALEFFEKSNTGMFSPARFCHPFYKSFYTITFKGQEAKAEVEKYLAEAKKAMGSSESKEGLLEAIENLGNALKEAQKLREMGLESMKSELNAYRRYCDRAVELLDATDDKAPGASGVIRRGLPIIDERIKQIIEEIQEKAKIGCQQSIGTPNEEIACAVNQKTQCLPIDDLEQLTGWVDDFVFLLKAKIPLSPANKYVHDEIDKIRNERDIFKQLSKILLCVGLIPTEVTMIDNSKKIEITNSSVGDVVQADTVHLDKSTNVSFNASEFSVIIEEILHDMEKIGAKDSNSKLAKLELEKAKLQAESGECSKTVATTMDNAVRYLKRSEEIINSAGNISQLLMKAGKLVGYAVALF